MISAGLIGATGYTGKKLIRFCQAHPHISGFSLYAAASAGKTLWQVFPGLMNITEDLQVQSVDNLSMDHDVYFITLPHGEAMRVVPRLVAHGKKVIDLGGDYRLDFEELYRQWYTIEHTSAYLLQSKLYGLADYLDAEAYSGAQLIANPGCYPTAALLSLLPLAQHFSDNILSASTVAYSGTSGAGKTPKTEMLLSEMDGNARAYNVNRHRHEPEILQMLYRFTFKAPYSFTAHLLPAAVGIYSTTVVHLREPLSPRRIEEVYEAEYAYKPFVRLRKEPPELQWVLATNYCDLHISTSGTTVVITAALDNLIKGAAGQAMQNLNRLYGWYEAEGISRTEVHYSAS